MKKIISFLCLVAVPLSLISCTSSKEKTYVPKVGEEVQYLSDVKLDIENSFFDGFSSGVNKDNWFIGKQAWGLGNGGVVPGNVKYTDDGALAISGNGKYYNDGDIKGVGDVKDGRYTGGALISKFLVQSGHYEIKMKVLPRQGSCTAFWIYANNPEDGSNHEIDIELPGGHRGDTITFSNVLNTNYITEQMSQSQDVSVNSWKEEGAQNIYLNDGEWHTFVFDWYTNPEMVVYSVDGVVSAVSDIFVPNMQSRLWVGCWFPVATTFVGSAEFETDMMYVDYVKYIPFKDQPFTEFVPPFDGYANDNEYPKAPISTPKINKVSNGGFEKVQLKETSLGAWQVGKLVGEDRELSELIEVIPDEGFEQSNALKIIDTARVSQVIDSIYHTFKHHFSLYAKGNGKILLRYYGKTTSDILETISIPVNEENLTYIQRDIVAPEKTQSLRISFETTKGNSLFIDEVKAIYGGCYE